MAGPSCLAKADMLGRTGPPSTPDTGRLSELAPGRELARRTNLEPDSAVLSVAAETCAATALDIE
jgi:hypothetical protein